MSHDVLTALAMAVHKLTGGEPVTLTPEDTAKTVGIKIDLPTEGSDFTVAVVEDPDGEGD